MRRLFWVFVGLVCITGFSVGPQQSSWQLGGVQAEDEPEADPTRQAQSEQEGPSRQNSDTPNSAGQDPVERGRYLVLHVAMCVQCHSPRSDDGQLIRERLLQGGQVPVSQPYRNLPWAYHAPRLAGLPGWQETELVQLLTEGRREGQPSPRPPMPPFRLAEEDARAVAAYLKSLAH